MSDTPKQKLTSLPPEVENQAVAIAKDCVSPLTLATDFIFGGEKHPDGTYKNPFSKEGRDKMYDACLEDVAAPYITKNGGKPKDIDAVTTKTKDDKGR